jgi:NAD-dependent deacetylase
MTNSPTVPSSSGSSAPRGLEAQAEKIAEIIRESEYVVGMTGAGMSVESGIPPFRGADGLWTKYGNPPMDGYSKFKEDPTGWWNRRTNEKIDAHILELRDALANAEPHDGHYALAGLEQQGSLQSVVTQNIDGLDEKAGLQNLIEIHGNRTKLRCIECGDRVSLGEFVPLFAPDPCKKCEGLVKFDTVMFGEPIPDDVMKAARAEIDKADCVLAIGTSATVRPASGLLWIAEAAGATIVEINPTETKLTSLCAVSLRSTAGEALPALLKILSE